MTNGCLQGKLQDPGTQIIQDADCDEGFFDLSTRASGESKVCCSIFDLNVDLCEEDFSDIGYR